MFDQHRRWKKKFKDALRGLREGARGQDSFHIHIPTTVFVLGTALALRMDFPQLCILILCIGGVVTAELLNSAIEWLARAITDQEDERIRNALDIAAGAVLFMSICAVTIGALLFGQAIWLRCC
jgi:diacylglycerol kinase